MCRRRFRALALATVAVACTALPALAHDGMVPVYAPLVIGASGKYHLTSNISAGGAIIMIGPGATDVDIDLNGFTITQTAAAAASITVAGPGPDHLVIRNGTITGGGSAIDIPGGFAPALRKVIIEGLKIHDTSGAGIHLGEVLNAVIRDTEIQAAGGDGILWDGLVGSKSGTIENNLIRSATRGISISTCASVALVSNRIEFIGIPAIPPAGSGIELISCGGSLVAENTIENVSGNGIWLRNSRVAKLFDNVIRSAGCNGIHLDTGTLDTKVWRNVVAGNGFIPGGCPVGQPAGDGILVEADRTHLDGNTVHGNARMGIHLTGPGSVPPNPAGACFTSFTLNSTVGNTGAGGGACVGTPGAPIPPDFCNNVPVGVCAAGNPGSTSGGHNVKAGSGVY